MKRIIFDIILFILVFMVPWWIPVVIALIGLFAFRGFYEFLFVMSIIYATHAIPGTGMLTSPTWFAFWVSILFIGAHYSRRFIIFYKNEI